MSVLVKASRAAVIVASWAGVAHAQVSVPIHALPPVARVSAPTFRSVATVVPLSDGRVFVNDRLGRQLLLLDSTLSAATVIADTTDATGNAYGRAGELIRFRGDTALYIETSSLSMLVLAPTGKVARVMAVPRPEDVFGLLGNEGLPAFDAQGRLVYYSGPGFGIMRLGIGPIPPALKARLDIDVDTGYVVRANLTTRVLDTAAAIRVTRQKREGKLDSDGNLQAILTYPDPMPVNDDWAVMADGSIAIVRGRDFHLDWIGPSGASTSTPKIPFDWRRATDEEKAAATDSTVKRIQQNLDAANGVRPGGGASGGQGTSSRGGPPPTGAAPRARSSDLAPNLLGPVSPNDLPDYMPAIIPSRYNTTLPNALFADAEDRLWIRTTEMKDGQPVYYVVDRRGALVDRVQLPPFRAIAGFGPNVVYMAVQDASGAVHLERARIK